MPYVHLITHPAIPRTLPPNPPPRHAPSTLLSPPLPHPTNPNPPLLRSQGRTALLKQRFSTNRASATATTAGGGGKLSKAAAGGWAAVAELVDPAGSGGAGGGAGAGSGKAGGAGPAKDVARFKQMLLKLKAQQLKDPQGKKK